MIRYVALFTSPTCKPCHAMKPLYKQLCEANFIDLRLYDIATDAGMEFADTIGVRAVPTALLMDMNGAVVERIVGAQPRAVLENALTRKRD